MSLAKQRIRPRKLLGNHLIAERWDNGDPESFIAHQQPTEIRVKKMLVDIDDDNPDCTLTTAFPALVRY